MLYVILFYVKMKIQSSVCLLVVAVVDVNSWLGFKLTWTSKANKTFIMLWSLISDGILDIIESILSIQGIKTD